MTDDDLRRGLAAGEADAFARLYDRFAPALFRTAWGLLGSAEEAEDAVQDVFVSLLKAQPAAVADLRAYLFAALRHAAGKRRTRQRPAEPLPAELPGPPGPPSPDEDLERALRRLPAEQREAVVLKVDGGLTFAELAAVLGISPNTAASRYRYALAKLRDLMERPES
jgi:RNA polymerase sigma-70 factor (ECF subfamily)